MWNFTERGLGESKKNCVVQPFKKTWTIVCLMLTDTRQSLNLQKTSSGWDRRWRGQTNFSCGQFRLPLGREFSMWWNIQICDFPKSILTWWIYGRPVVDAACCISASILHNIVPPFTFCIYVTVDYLCHIKTLEHKFWLNFFPIMVALHSCA